MYVSWAALSVGTPKSAVLYVPPSATVTGNVTDTASM